jgi:hypothetical protein
MGGWAMKTKSAEQILSIAWKKSDTPLGQTRVINRLFRQQDDSGKWPIKGRFNATERAIRRIRGTCDSPDSYARALEREMSIIVNSDKNR